MPETLTKLDNLSRTVRASARLSSIVIQAGMQRQDREQKSFVEIKPVPVIKHVES